MSKTTGRKQRFAPRAAICVVATASLLHASANAQLVAGWGLDTTLSAASLAEGAPGAFSVTTPTGNAGPRALLASPIPFAAVGDVVQLRGTATMQNSLGNQQFRFGLYHPNGRATGTLAGGVWTGADVAGWLGYMVSVGGSGGADTVRGRNGSGTSAWLANGDSTIVGSAATGITAAANTPYTFSLTLTRTGAASVKADYTFVGGAINRSGSFTDAIPTASAGMTSIAAVGFLLNGNTGAAQFSNVAVEVPTLLRLRVNTTTGFASIANRVGDAALPINYYEIASAAGALAPGTWMSLDGNLPASTTTWEKAGGATANILSETNLLASLPVAPASPYAAIGQAFTPGGAQDLVFRYGLTDGALATGIVEYVTGGPEGDFDVDGDVDGRDFLVWQRGAGDALTPADLANWRSSFGATPAAAATVRIPEPAGLALIAWCAAAVAGRTRRRRRRSPAA